jgi:hypothetical protein
MCEYLTFVAALFYVIFPEFATQNMSKEIVREAIKIGRSNEVMGENEIYQYWGSEYVFACIHQWIFEYVYYPRLADAERFNLQESYKIVGFLREHKTILLAQADLGFLKEPVLSQRLEEINRLEVIWMTISNCRTDNPCSTRNYLQALKNILTDEEYMTGNVQVIPSWFQLIP